MGGKTMQVLLVDDDPSCREDLRQSLAAFPYVTVVGEADGAASAILQFQTKQIDLVFLDIELGTESGFQLARHIHQAYPACMVVFLTGHVSFALEGYEYGPVDFLVKPTNLMRLEQALLQVRGRLELYAGQAVEDDCVGIQSGSRLEIVQVKKILYLEKKGWKVLLVCEGGETIPSRESLQALEPTFLPRGFYRCHQSFLIPVRRIRSVQLDDSKHTYSLYLEGVETPLPLSRDKFSGLRQLLSERGLAIH